jgi:hypothetical protein
MSTVLQWTDSAASLRRDSTPALSLVRPLEEAVDARLGEGPATIQELVAIVASEGRAERTIRNRVNEYLQDKRRAGLVEAERSAGGPNVWSVSQEAGTRLA